MLGTRQEIARLQSDFYRDQYRRALRQLFASSCLIVVLICTIIYLVLFKESPDYYASTVEGQIIPMAVIGGK